jgi:peptide/nickel transport system permease protein
MIWFSAKTVLGAAFKLLLAAAIIHFTLELVTGPSPGWVESNEHFWRWLAALLVGDFGTSRTLDAPVATLLLERLAVTAPLIGLALLLAGALGVGLGYAAARSGGGVDRALMALTRAVTTLPSLWIALMLVLTVATTLHWLPTGGFVVWTSNPAMSLVSLLLPAFALALPAAAAIAAALRDAMQEARNAPYFRAALARGLSAEQALRQHARRNITTRVLERATPAIVALLPASVIVEAVFYLPGLGRLLLDGAVAGDAPVVRAGLSVFILGLLIVWAALRIGRAFSDPRLWRRTAT